MKQTPGQEKGDNGTLETVKIKADNADGYAVINAHEFNKDVHEKFEPAAKAKK